MIKLNFNVGINSRSMFLKSWKGLLICLPSFRFYILRLTSQLFVFIIIIYDNFQDERKSSIISIRFCILQLTYIRPVNRKQNSPKVASVEKRKTLILYEFSFRFDIQANLYGDQDYKYKYSEKMKITPFAFLKYHFRRINKMHIMTKCLDQLEMKMNFNFIYEYNLILTL